MKAILKIICASVSVLIIIGVLIYNYYVYYDPFFFLKGSVKIENLNCSRDQDNDGINDLDDILEGARQEVINETKYQSTYCKGGYPPASEGVCTDVIWRGLKNAGYDLKAEMDKDIAANLKDYSAGVIKPDPNIDFRRVKNQFVFFKKYATSLTTEVIPYNKANLAQWQRGDIIVLKKSEHVGIISDVRRKDGVPYVVHNTPPNARESDSLYRWHKQGRIIGHFRYPAEIE